MSNIDWSNAPEGATHYQPNDSDCYEAWYKNIEAESYQIMMIKESKWSFCDYISDAKRNGTLIPRPVVTPTFTQAMADAGTLPSVGMELMYLDCSSNKYIHCVVMYFSKWAVVLRQIGEGYGKDVEIAKSFDDVNIKPLTPPIELIDGKAYQFEYEGQTRYAPYNKSINFFSDIDKHINPDSCSNIQLLEVTK